MKITVNRPCEIELSIVDLSIPVRHGDECMPFDFPGRTGDEWNVLIDINTGNLQLSNGNPFPAVAHDLQMKVCDCCAIKLLDSDGTIVHEQVDYVPDFFPGKHYGDYIEFDIACGKIQNWAPDRDDLESLFNDGD